MPVTSKYGRTPPNKHGVVDQQQQGQYKPGFRRTNHHLYNIISLGCMFMFSIGDPIKHTLVANIDKVPSFVFISVEL